jgi:hypothetical protein
MDSKLSIRNLVEEDYEIICKWWKWWRFVPVAKESLPDNGTGGFMIECNGVNICAGFLYTTNSNLCKIEWIISNYEVRDKQIRKKSLEILINALTNKAKELGFKIAFTYLVNKKLKEKFKECGFIESNKPIEMIKII